MTNREQMSPMEVQHAHLLGLSQTISQEFAAYQPDHRDLNIVVAEAFREFQAAQLTSG